MEEQQFEHLKKLNSLSTSMSEVLRDIMQLAYAHVHQMPWIADAHHMDIKLLDGNLWINRIMIPLGTRPKTLCLLQAFFKSESLGLTKNQIVDAVYGPQAHRSERFQEAQDHSLTKLLSRTRTYLEVSLAHAYPGKPIDWLVFDIRTKRYHLYQLRNFGSGLPKP